jgi:hypothetical protein
MSLVRLLAAGKSVVGLSNEVSPYRLTDQRLLPKFGPDKPWSCPTVKGAGGGGSPKSEVRRPRCVEGGRGLKGPGAASVAAFSWGGHPARVLGWLKGPPRATVEGPRAPGGARPGGAGRRLTSRFNGLFGRSELKPERQPRAPLEPSPIQGELRLERVKVVRNDLSDSDLELVQLRPRAGATKPKEVGMGKRGFWGLAGVRSLLGLFRAKRT